MPSPYRKIGLVIPSAKSAWIIVADIDGFGECGYRGRLAN